MLISPVNCNSYRGNKTQHKIKAQAVNFQGAKNLQAIDINSFKDDGAKLLYGKIKKYLQIIGNSGKVENVPLNKSGDMFLSINKNINSVNKTKILIKNKNNECLMNANFNKDGQMTVGDFADIHFERTDRNKRTMYCSEKRKITTYYESRFLSPHGYDDREFGFLSSEKSDYITPSAKNGSSKASLFELFIEFARLHTSIFK